MQCIFAARQQPSLQPQGRNCAPEAARGGQKTNPLPDLRGQRAP